MKKNIFKNKGFTILETLIAVVLLSLVLNSVFTLISGTLFAAQYARNEMTASYLLQESVDYIRNTRDTQLKQDPLNGWANFLSLYDLGSPNANNPKKNYCFINIAPSNTNQPNCNQLNGGNASAPLETIYYYPETHGGNYYSTDFTSGAKSTSFKRSIILSKNNNGDEVDVSVRLNWVNGLTSKSKTYNISFTNWQSSN